MRGFLDYVHFCGLILGIVLTIDTVSNLETAGNNPVYELSVALVALVLSFTAYTLKSRF